jgi:hypothetical protein
MSRVAVIERALNNPQREAPERVWRSGDPFHFLERRR